MALSILKQRINKREYKQFGDFVRDCALVRAFYYSTESLSLSSLTILRATS